MTNIPVLVAWAELSEVAIWCLVGFFTMGMAGWLHVKEKEYPGSAQAGTALILAGFGMWCWALLAELPQAVKMLAWAYS